jgi:arginine repressor
MKNTRQKQILALIAEHEITTQEELIEGFKENIDRYFNPKEKEKK